MSNDLISRKALLTALSKWDISKLYLVDAFKELVKEQRTAYDIDKVVEQLEVVKLDVKTQMTSRSGKAFFEGTIRGLNKAIKIVKGGSDE